MNDANVDYRFFQSRTEWERKRNMKVRLNRLAFLVDRERVVQL